MNFPSALTASLPPWRRLRRPSKRPPATLRGGAVRARLTIRGFNLVELIIYMSLAGAVLAVGVPPVAEWTASLRVRAAALEISGVMHQARADAVRNSRNVAVRFHYDEERGRMSWDLYGDGDGDGVRARDIKRGIDYEIQAPREFAQFGGKVRLGFPPGVSPRHPSNPARRLGRLTDPIRFNRSDMASFSPFGTATPGSIYLTDGKHRLTAVRTDHQSGRIRVRTYDVEQEVWR